ncbi:MAG: hypothetical protein HQ498_15450 [Pseudohongiella sp.]|nr:hypothetical protein [Pseudohongiella sp.]
MRQLQIVFSSFCLLLSGSGAFAQANSRADALNELELSRKLLIGLEETMGPMNQRLVESLEQVADNLMALNEFDDAHSMLDRALQITRINQGLYTQDQLPFLNKKIENHANQGDWDKARQQMEHLLWLYQTKQLDFNENLISRLLQLSNFHLRAITEDAEAWQAYHFRHVTEIKWMTLGLAERVWGKSDPRMVPVLYSQVTQLHRLLVAIERGGSTGYGLREIRLGSGIVTERKAVRRGLYFTGMTLLNTMQRVYQSADAPNREGLAMSQLYLADWQLLFNRPEEALTGYRLAYRGLIEAEIEPGLINHLFSQPLVLPAPKFFSSVQQALQAREGNRVPDEVAGAPGAVTYLFFKEWSSAFSNVRNPLPAIEMDEESNFALFSFRLAGLDEVSRWISGRYTRGVGVVNEAELLEQTNVPSYPEKNLLERLNMLRFRPKLIEGEPQEVNGLLQYHLAADTFF